MGVRTVWRVELQPASFIQITSSATVERSSSTESVGQKSFQIFFTSIGATTKPYDGSQGVRRTDKKMFHIKVEVSEENSQEKTNRSVVLW